MSNNFAELLKQLLQAIAKGVGSLGTNWDQKSYESVVNCLTFKDELAVKEAVDQLVREGKPLAIPPLYLASQRHPKIAVREYCWKSLGKMDSIEKINTLTSGKDINSALHDLIEEYGHFKTDYY